MVKNLPANAGEVGNVGSIARPRRSPGEGNCNSSILTWEIPWTDGRGRLQSMGA